MLIVAGETFFSALENLVFLRIICLKIGDSMVTNLERFKAEMEPARQLYAQEIRRFARKYDALGEMTMGEFPDIDVQEYIFDFEKVNGTSEEEIDKIYDEIIDHMDEFSKAHGIEKFCQWVRIFI